MSVAASAPASPTPSARWSRCRTPSRSTVARRPAAAPRRRARACAAPAPRLGKLGGRPRWISRRSSSWGLPGERRAEDHQEIRQGRSGARPHRPSSSSLRMDRAEPEGWERGRGSAVRTGRLLLDYHLALALAPLVGQGDERCGFGARRRRAWWHRQLSSGQRRRMRRRRRWRGAGARALQGEECRPSTMLVGRRSQVTRRRARGREKYLKVAVHLPEGNGGRNPM